MFFNEQGMLNLDEAVMNQPTFKKINDEYLPDRSTQTCHYGR